MKKRILCLLLALMMVVSMFPAPAYATDSDAAAETPTQTPTTAATEAPAQQATQTPTEASSEAATQAPCGTCGQTGCTSEHLNWCDVCKKDDCGQTHETTAPSETADPSETTAPAETTKVDNCPYCEDTTAGDGTVVHAAGCNAAYAYNGSADVGKYVKLNPAVADYIINVCDGTDFEDSLAFCYDEFDEDLVMVIRNWYWNSELTDLWYQVDAYSGSFPASTEEFTWPQTAWIMQNYTDDSNGPDALMFATICGVCGGVNCPTEHKKCPACGEYDCEIEHVKCDICGEYDCVALHFYCDICAKHDCGKDHLYCTVCESFTCTVKHVWCGLCAKYDCGVTHKSSKPATAPEIPSNPTLTPNKDVTIVDKDGDVTIVDKDGNPVAAGGFALPERTKASLSAWTELTGSLSYQWQVCYDIANDLWVDIEGQNRQGILVSPAMFLKLASQVSAVKVRCTVTDGTTVQTSDAIPVTMQSQTETVASARAARRMGAVAKQGISEDSGELQKAYVVVNYVYSDGRTAATADFAEITPSSAYHYNYTLPVIPGYKATLKTHSFTNEQVKLANGTLTLSFAANVLTEAYTIFTVEYVPDYVSYTVIHYWQNVDNDKYTEHERVTITNTHKTGEVITDVQKTYPGFYSLLYETPAAAADGSTVIEVYYDRYYYLMTFELGDMGYGVDPVYARYGETLEIGTPTRAGYTFLGWKLNGTGDTIASADMPTTMPSENRKYVAQWQAADTAKVTIVFWGENPDDEGYSYVKSEEIYAKPGISYTFSENGGLICGYHDHNADCYTLTCTQEPHNHATDGCALSCTKTVHTHSSSACCTKASEIHTLGTSCYGDNVGAAFSASLSEHWVEGTETNGSVGESYYTYIVGSAGTGNKYIYINGTWYRYTGSVVIGGTVSTVCNGIHSHSDHTCVYCKQNLEEHTHTDSCYVCGKVNNSHTHTNYTGSCYTLSCDKPTHTHTNACYDDVDGLDSNLWTFVRSDTVTVEANGSSVMNVYFDRKEFTLTFIRNSSTVKTITEKWGADIHSEFPIKDGNNTMWWTVPSGCTSMKPGTEFGSLDTMPSENIRFTYDDQTSDATLHYYVEALPNGEGKTASEIYSGFTSNSYPGIDSTKKYVSYKDINVTTSGYLTYTEEFHNIVGFRQYISYPKFDKHEQGGTTDNIKKDNYLMYARNAFDIVFYNPNELIKTQENVPYQMPLNSYNWTPTLDQAPDEYEPGSIKFGGWYLNAECTGEQFDFTANTMPAGPNNTNGEVALALYAKWEPVEYKVNYFFTKESFDRDETIPEEIARLAAAAGVTLPEDNPYTVVFSEDIIKHGAYIGYPGNPKVAEGYKDIHPRSGYDFIGWFYVNENGEETAFDPENMPVHQDLDLYGKWSSDKLCKYNIYYVLDTNGDGVADTDASGRIIYVADPDTGSGIAGNTYTFAAKGGEALYDPEGEANYREGYFPHVGSHSLTIDVKDEAGANLNSFTFFYRPREAVPYTVKYLEKGTDKVLYTQKTVSDNKNIVVTENFVYIEKYMPDAYQKTLVVSTGGENEIIFYYTKDEVHALYVVNYYIQDLDSNLNHAGWSKYTDLQRTGDIGTEYSASAITIDGFTLSPSYTDQYNTGDKKNAFTGATLPTAVSNLVAAADSYQISGVLGEAGMELNFYYTRNLYPYEFRYMLMGTNTQLAAPVVGKAGYDSTVTKAYKEIEMDLDGDGVNEDYRLYDPTETTKDIHIKKDGNPLASDAEVTAGQATVNVATFYYVRCTQTMTITKRVVDNSAELNPDPDEVFDFSLLIHSKNGYHQSSYTCTDPDGTKGTLTPEITAPNTLRFSLKAGQTITIEGLPTAEYTITELDLPTGYYDTAGTGVKYKLTVDAVVRAEVTNSFEPANLVISKTVDVEEEGTNTPEVSEFEFTIEVPVGVTGTYSYTVGDATHTATVVDGKMTIKLQRGQTATFLNLPVGTYTVTEADYSAKGYDSNYKVNNASSYTEGSVASTPLVRGETTTVEFMNKFPVGDLTIVKTVRKEFYRTAWEGDNFTFTVVRTTGKRPLIAGNKYKVEIDAKEQEAMAVVDEYGNLTVSIPFGAEDAEVLKKEGTFVAHSLVIKNLPAGTYTVTEGEKTGYIQEPTGLAVTGLTIPAEETKASFTNTLERKKGDLYLEKELEVLEGHTNPETIRFSFTVELLEGIPTDDQTFTVSYTPDTYTDNTAAATTVTMEANKGTFTLALEADQKVTVTGLPEGKYRITEATIPYYANSYLHKVNNAWVLQEATATEQGQMYTEIEVPNGAAAEVKCTNVYPVDTAELIIQKLLTKEYDRDTVPTDSFSFKVTLTKSDFAIKEIYNYKVYNANGTQDTTASGTAAVTNNAFTITLKAGQYAVIPDMPVCNYTVTENVSTADCGIDYKVFVYDTGDSVSTTVNAAGTADQTGKVGTVTRTFSAGKTDAVVFTNEYKRHLGRLTVTKTVSGTPAEDGVFIFRIQGISDTNNTVDMEISITGSGSKVIYDLPLGKYTVTEITDWSWRYTNTDNTEDAVLTVTNPDAEVTIANTHSEHRWLDHFMVEDNIFRCN